MTRWRNHPWPSTPAVLAAQAVALGVTVTLTLLGGRWWQALVSGAVLAGCLLVPVRGRLAADWLATAIRFRWHHPPAEPPITDFRTADGTVTGVVHDTGTMCAVVELTPARGIVRFARATVVDDHAIPLTILAESLLQHDIPLAGLDVVAHGSRIDTASPTARVHDALLGPLGVAAIGSVWVVVRFDATGNPAPVARRGGGSDGAARTLAIATHRVTRRLADTGITGRVLAAAEIRAVRAALGGADHTATPAKWSSAPVGAGHSCGATIDPRFVTTETLTQVWATRTTSTTTALRIRPARGGVTLAGSCRFTTPDPQGIPRLPGLAPTSGLERDAVSAHLPGAPARLDALTAFTFADHTRLAALTVSAGGHGQLIGSDAEGRAVAARLVGPDIDRVDVIGEHYLVRQVVVRALSTGARITVHTAWPDRWRPLVDMIDARDRLALAGDPTAPAPTAILYDGVEPGPTTDGVTVLRSAATAEEVPGRATVRLEQPGSRGSRIVLWAGGIRADLTMVSTSAEAAYIGQPYRPAPFAPAG